MKIKGIKKQPFFEQDFGGGGIRCAMIGSSVARLPTVSPGGHGIRIESMREYWKLNLTKQMAAAHKKGPSFLFYKGGVYGFILVTHYKSETSSYVVVVQNET